MIKILKYKNVGVLSHKWISNFNVNMYVYKWL